VIELYMIFNKTYVQYDTLGVLEEASFQAAGVCAADTRFCTRS